MDLGIVLGPPLRELDGQAREAEDAGFESVWCAETARSAYVQAAIIGAATSRVAVGTDIALAFPRSPTITAMAARDLAELTDGRFVLGLGTQVRRIVEDRFSAPFDRPAARVSDAIEAIRAVLHAYGGDPIDHQGPFYRIVMPPFPGAGAAPGQVPIYLAAVNRVMLETAGRVADGVLGHPMTSPAWVREVVRPAIARGAAEAGRDPSVVNVSTSVILQMAVDRAEARREAALQIGFYATTPSYKPVLEFHGYGELLTPLRKAFGRRDFAAMAEIAEPMVNDLAVAGDPDECREHLATFEGAVDRVILGGAWVGPSEERMRANHALILETFGPARA
jgi:probable F420-dependent oxidoreductase